MSNPPLRQLIYHSIACEPRDPARILEQSRHNNALDGVTGILWSNGRTFVQVLEGPSFSVGETFGRIARDTRHEAVTILSDRYLQEREFGYWSMEGLTFAGSGQDIHASVPRRPANLPADVQERFLEAIR